MDSGRDFLQSAGEIESSDEFTNFGITLTTTELSSPRHIGDRPRGVVRTDKPVIVNLLYSKYLELHIGQTPAYAGRIGTGSKILCSATMIELSLRPRNSRWRLHLRYSTSRSRQSPHSWTSEGFPAKITQKAFSKTANMTPGHRAVQESGRMRCAGETGQNTRISPN